MELACFAAGVLHGNESGFRYDNPSGEDTVADGVTWRRVSWPGPPGSRDTTAWIDVRYVTPVSTENSPLQAAR
ncbi:hypothetical protein AYO38_06295 [bacterium SCGC AG-212-C10]|nr:hypothetical protein AYO38_06295 [bacterium SCGC AG-212-C10]